MGCKKTKNGRFLVYESISKGVLSFSVSRKLGPKKKKKMKGIFELSLLVLVGLKKKGRREGL